MTDVQADQTVLEATAAWIEWRDGQGELAATTVRNYQDVLRRFSYLVGPNRGVSSLTHLDVERFRAEMVARKITRSTLRWRLVVLQNWTRWLYEEGLVEKDPCQGMKLPRKTRSVPRGLSSDKIVEVLRAARDARERLMVSLMVREGLRACEVASLELEDIDCHEHTLRVVGKGGHERVIPLTDATGTLIDAYLKERGIGAGRLLQPYQRAAWNPAEGLTAATVVVYVGRILKRAGVKDGGHALRHTYAYGLMEAGADVRDVQLALGHASLATTEVYLPRLRLDRLRRFVGQQEYHLDIVDQPTAETSPSTPIMENQ